jgi:hypothetical protein
MSFGYQSEQDQIDYIPFALDDSPDVGGNLLEMLTEYVDISWV